MFSNRRTKNRTLPALLSATTVLCVSHTLWAQEPFAGPTPAAEPAPAAAEAPSAANAAPPPQAEPVAPAAQPAPQAVAPTTTAVERSDPRWAAPAAGPIDPGVAEKKPSHTERKGRFTFIPKVGIGLGGSGEREETETCSATYPSCDSPEKDDYEDSSKLVIGADALFGVSNNLRLGVGSLYVPSRTAEDGDIKVGSDLSVFAVAEAVIDVSPTLALALRGQAGGIMLFPGGDLQDDIDEEKRQACSASGCEVGEGPFPGFTYGFGAGVIAPIGAANARVDVLYHAHVIDRMREKEDLGFGGTKEEREKTTGHQVWLMAGLEL